MEEPEARVVPGFELVGEDGNIFAILGRFKRQARRDGWSAQNIERVTQHVRNLENYDLAIAFMVKFVDWGDDEEDEDEEEHGYDDDVMFGEVRPDGPDQGNSGLIGQGGY